MEVLAGLNPFEQRVLRQLESLGVARGRWLIGVSGGVDSMVLWRVLCRLAQRRPMELFAVHIHHGGEDEYRERASQFVQKECDSRVVRADRDLRTEQECRRFRREKLNDLFGDYTCDYICLAHNHEDLLETRLMRLIRGCGPQGLSGMSVRDGVWLRPLLEFGRREIEVYAQERGVNFVTDPTNSEGRYLRNWLRNDWLPQLEQRVPGACLRLAQSLGNLVDFVHMHKKDYDFMGNRIDRRKFSSLSTIEKREMMGAYMRKNQVDSFGQTHIDELIKRLQTNRKSYQIQMLGKLWVVDAEHFFLQD